MPLIVRRKFTIIEESELNVCGWTLQRRGRPDLTFSNGFVVKFRFKECYKFFNNYYYWWAEERKLVTLVNLLLKF